MDQVGVLPSRKVHPHAPPSSWDKIVQSVTGKTLRQEMRQSYADSDLSLTPQALLWDVMHPASRLKVAWDIAILTLLFYVCIAVPYIVCFDVTEKHKTSFVFVLDLMVDCIFTWDIYMSFRTGYFSPAGKVVMQRKEVALHYLKSWFFFDVISTFPFDLVLMNKNARLFVMIKAGRLMRFSKIVRLLKILKMMRLMRLPRLLRSMEEMIGLAVIRMMAFVLSALMMTHWCACAFYYSASMEPNHSWVRKNGLQQATNTAKYINALYWSVTTMATVGYGDIVAVNMIEKVVSMIAEIIGASVFAYFMSAMASLVAALNVSRTRITTKLRLVDDFLRHRKLPPGLADRVRNYYAYTVEREVHADEGQIIVGLSRTLRNEVVLHLYSEALARVPFFRNKDPNFITSVVMCFKLEYYAPGDVVVTQGETGSEMYFITEGLMEVRVYDEPPDEPLVLPKYTRRRSSAGSAILDPHLPQYQSLGFLHSGQYFGEYACIMGTVRTATIIADSYCELYSLSRSDLDRVLGEFPELCADFDKLINDCRAGSTLEPVGPHDSLQRSKTAEAALRSLATGGPAGGSCLKSMSVSLQSLNASAMRQQLQLRSKAEPPELQAAAQDHMIKVPHRLSSGGHPAAGNIDDLVEPIEEDNVLGFTGGMPSAAELDSHVVAGKRALLSSSSGATSGRRLLRGLLSSSNEDLDAAPAGWPLLAGADKPHPAASMYRASPHQSYHSASHKWTQSQKDELKRLESLADKSMSIDGLLQPAAPSALLPQAGAMTAAKRATHSAPSSRAQSGQRGLRSQDASEDQRMVLHDLVDTITASHGLP